MLHRLSVLQSEGSGYCGLGEKGEGMKKNKKGRKKENKPYRHRQQCGNYQSRREVGAWAGRGENRGDNW